MGQIGVMYVYKRIPQDVGLRSLNNCALEADNRTFLPFTGHVQGMGARNNRGCLLGQTSWWKAALEFGSNLLHTSARQHSIGLPLEASKWAIIANRQGTVFNRMESKLV